MTFVSLRRKYLRLFVGVFFFFIITLSLLTTFNIINYDIKALQMLDLNDNYFGKIYSDHFLKNDDYGTANSKSTFSKKVDKILDGKIANDIENKFWLLNEEIKSSFELNVPKYYFKDYKDVKPDVQPFDPRFTLAMYVNHIKQSLDRDSTKVVEIPFHWSDWVDLTALNVHLLAPTSEKPDCSLVDARDDEGRMKTEKEAEKAKEEQELVDYEKTVNGGKPVESKEGENKENTEENKPEENKPEENKEGNSENKPEEKPEEEQPQPPQEQSQPAQPEGPKLAKRLEAHDPKSYCLNDNQLPFDHSDGNTIRPGFNVFRAPGRVTEEIGIITGKSYLYSFAPPPDQIIILTKDGSYNATYNGHRNSLLSNGIVEQYVASTNSKSIDLSEQFQVLQSSHASNKYMVIEEYEISLEPADFNVDFDKVIGEYDDQIRTGKRVSSTELRYYQSLKYSKHKVDNGGPPKYFYESRLLNTAIGDHYDWRFFNGIQYGTYEQTLTLHHLIRAFLSFCRKTGINTWVAHGSLLSWYWNGIAFPWDNDIDVQMPIYDLHKLSRDFNQTLVVEDPEDGVGRYFIDCGSFITLRKKGNGNNNIDARFIDLDTGLYIDITGLAVSDTSPPDRYKKQLPANWAVDEKSFEKTNEYMQVYNCRNNHFSHLNELTPLIKSPIEGEIGYIPKKFTEILNVEYSKGLLSKSFSNHIFLQQLRLWIKEEDLYYFLNDREKWNNYHNYQEHYIKNKEISPELEVDYELTDEEKKKLKLDAKLREKNGEKVSDTEYKTKLKDGELDLIFNLNEDQLIQLLKKDEILMEYIASKDFTSFHEPEILRLLVGKSTKSMVNNLQSFKPMKMDPFMFKVFRDYIDYDQEIDDIVQLNQIYKANESNE